jgi:hypothetical protein
VGGQSGSNSGISPSSGKGFGRNTRSCQEALNPCRHEPERISVQRSVHEQLPQPDHPFARWGVAAAVAVWALSAQSLMDPWNKIAAILSPGIGYLVGQVLDAIFIRVSEINLKKSNDRKTIDITQRMQILINERNQAVSVGADPEIIIRIDTAIRQFHQEKIRILTA